MAPAPGASMPIAEASISVGCVDMTDRVAERRFSKHPATTGYALTGKAQMVLAQLEDRFALGHYKFGTKIYASEIAEEFDVSRQPVMAALTRLRLAGFLTIIPQVGCEVVSPSHRDLEDFYRLFSRMEALASALAAERSDDTDVDRIRASNSPILKLAGESEPDGDLYRGLNRDFHRAIHYAARSPMLHERVASLWPMSDFLLSSGPGPVFERHVRVAALEHEEIVEAIARSDSEAAARATEDHILSNVQRIDPF
jgi:DNA-binding GntR family transcriptional regulator